MNIAKLIEHKIAEGKALLQEIGSMRRSTGMAINVVYYIGEDVEDCKKQINKWQLTSKEIFTMIYCKNCLCSDFSGIDMEIYIMMEKLKMELRMEIRTYLLQM